MLQTLFDISRLEPDIRSGSLVITPNHRLAQKIQQSWGRACLSEQRSVWIQPRIYSLDQWIDERWLDACNLGFAVAGNGSPLTTVQEKILWQQILEEDSQLPAHLQPGVLAQHVQQSFATLCQWQIPDGQLMNRAPLLYRWIAAFRNKLRQKGFISRGEQCDVVRAAFVDEVLTQEAVIVLHGFQVITPLYRATLEMAAKKLRLPETPSGKGRQRKISLPDGDCEITAAAHWAQRQLATNAEARIGIVVHDLPYLRESVERIFRNRFDPHYSHPDRPRQVAPFNLSSGVTLDNCPLIRTALSLLEFNRHSRPIAEVGCLLNSPFWGGSSDTAFREMLENRLREAGRLHLQTGQMAYWARRCEEALPDHLPIDEPFRICKGLEDFMAMRRNAPKSASCRSWAYLFSRQLSALNWPGTRPLDSIEYQQRQLWVETLEEFCALDAVTGPVDIGTALYFLGQTIRNRVFQAESPDSPIQILGLLEASGLCFTHLWLIGMDDRKWPAPVRPDPLLPISLQREYLTPRCDPQRELELAKALLNDFCNNSNDTVFSFSEQDGEQSLGPSGLINLYPPLEMEDWNDAKASFILANPMPPVELEIVDCTYGPPLEVGNAPVKGGSAILGDQAVCPFNAFARYRLGAWEPGDPVLGLSPTERGIILHRSLERIWRELGTQAVLLKSTDDDLRNLIDDAVRVTLEPFRQNRADLVGPAFGALEEARLCDLLARWLEVEKQRPPFETIALEDRRDVVLAGLPLSLRVDRIDRLIDGREIIIDYKSGKPSSSRWFGERPEEPQLPLYAVTGETAVAALAYASINAEQQKFIGVGEDSTLLPGLDELGRHQRPETWPLVFKHWTQSLNGLAQEFISGYAPATIYNKTAFARQAELLPLNRCLEDDDPDFAGEEP